MLSAMICRDRHLPATVLAHPTRHNPLHHTPDQTIGWWAMALIALALMTGCANPIQRQASADCDPEAYQIFPRVMQMQRVTEPMVVQVPDGTHNCFTELVRPGDRASAVTRCTPNYTMQTRWVERWIQVDLNAKERTIWHARCVQQLCVERVGNPACEAPAPAPVSAPTPATK